MESQPLATCRVVRDRAFLEQAFDESVEHRLKYRKHFPKFAVGLAAFTVLLLIKRPGVVSALYFWGSAWIIWRGLTYRRRLLALGEASPAFGKELYVHFFAEHLETTANGEPIEAPYADFDRFDVTPGGFFFVSGTESIFVPKSKIEPPEAASTLEAIIRRTSCKSA